MVSSVDQSSRANIYDSLKPENLLKDQEDVNADITSQTKRALDICSANCEHRSVS